MGFGLKKEGDPQDLINYMQTEATKHGYKLELINHGIASRLGKTIIMNKHLPEYKQFCKGVFDHEMRHTANFSKKDLAMDVFEGSFLTNVAFCLKHPKGFTQFIPFGKYKHKFYIDLNVIFVYVIITLLVWGYFQL